MKKEPDLEGTEAKWAVFDICMEQGEHEKAFEILERNPEMLPQFEPGRETSDITDEEVESSFEKLMERLKREKNNGEIPEA